MAALATTAEVEGRLERSFTAAERGRLALLLDDASAAVRAYTGQTISVATSTNKRLRVRKGVVRLPQRPVNAVTTVKNTSGVVFATSSYTWDQLDRIEFWTYLPVANGPDLSEVWRRNAYVDVTYTHGYATIPPDIVAVVCQIAARAFGQQADRSGLSEASVGDASYSIGPAAASGGVGMLNDERAVLDRYRRPAGFILTESR
jgi:hypothetical protein